MKKIKSTFCFILALALVLSLGAPMASAAGTTASDKANTIFFYADDVNGERVLIKAIPYATIAAMAHGSDGTSATTYSHSYIDAYPCPSYKEGRGVTIPELIAYATGASSVSGASSLTYNGTDRLYFYSCDGASANYTYNALLGTQRYYYPDLHTYWSIDEAGVTDVDAVLATGVETEPYLATVGAGGRVLTATGNDAHPAIMSYITANGGNITGCLSGVMSDSDALTLCFAQTPSDVENGVATYSNVKKWVYSVRLKDAGTAITSLGTVAAPSCVYTLDGTTLTITMSCETGASIYYSTIGGVTQSPVNLYTEPIVIENYDTTSPFTISVMGAREGYVSSASVAYPSSNITEAPGAAAFVYALTKTGDDTVGGESVCSVSLTADADATIFSTQYSVSVPAKLYTLGEVTPAEGWQYGTSAGTDATVITFARLDTAGTAVAANTPIAVGSFKLAAAAAGEGSIAVLSAIVAKANAVPYSTVTAEDTAVIVTGEALGDIDGDGHVTVTDAWYTARIAAKLITPDAAQRASADVDGDGYVTVTDAWYVSRFAAKLITVFPASAQ